MKPKSSYHQQAQNFISSAKSKGYKVQAEGGEIIAYPKGMTPKKVFKKKGKLRKRKMNKKHKKSQPGDLYKAYKSKQAKKKMRAVC